MIDGPTWRPLAFRRFRLGQLDDRRDEWLEFWRHNHLLAPFAERSQRRELGDYGGEFSRFWRSRTSYAAKKPNATRIGRMSPCWMRSSMLACSAQARTGTLDRPLVLARVRSRIGFENDLQEGYLGDPAVVHQAILQSTLSIAHAYLLPAIPEVSGLPATSVPMEPVIEKRLRTVSPGSSLHLTLEEAVRRQCMIAMQATDRAD